MNFIPLIIIAIPFALGAWLWWIMRKIGGKRTAYSSRKAQRPPQTFGKIPEASARVDRVERPPRDSVPVPQGKRNPVPQPSAPVASSRQFKPYDEATVCFVVGKAYRCRDKEYGETAHRIIRRQRGRVQMTCDVIQYCSDYCPWRTITIVDGVETLEKGKIRADDEYLGPQNFTQSYIDAARGET